jgi:hypothetical protein
MVWLGVSAIFLIVFQDINRPVGDVLAKSTITDAVEGLNYWNENKNNPSLTDGEKLGFLIGTSAYKIKKNKAGVFEFIKTGRQDIKSRDELNEGIEKNLNLLANGDLLYGQPLLVFTVGNYGSLGGSSYTSCKVLQIVDKTTMLLTASIKSFRETEYHTFFVRGINTSSFVDGSDFYYDIIFVITGTQTYTTALGVTKKVYVLEAANQETLSYAADKVKEGFGPVWKKELEKLNAEIDQKKEMENKKKQTMIENKKKAEEDAKRNKINAANLKAKDLTSKLAAGLTSYTKRYDDSFNESNPKLADQMQAQAITYIQNGDKRLAEAVKAVKESTLPEDEKTALIKQATDALATAKKKVGVR